MRGYVAKRRNRFYAVIYEGIDPVTGRERRRWHPAGTDRAAAEQLAARIAADHRGERLRPRAGPTLGVYLTRTWLPSKQVTLRPSTWDTYRRNIELHVLPELGRVPIRHLRVEHLERLYAKLLDHGRANRAGGLDTKTVLEIHMVLRRALTDAVTARDHHPQPGRARARTETTAARQRRTTRLERPTTQGRFSTSPPTTDSSPRSGSPRTQACDAANSSGCDGATSIRGALVPLRRSADDRAARRRSALGRGARGAPRTRHRRAPHRSRPVATS